MVYRVACVQMEPHVGDAEGNRRASEARIREAASSGATLIVLPEAAAAGYVFQDRDEALQAAELVPSGPACELWQGLCRELNIWIIAGLTERDGEGVCNSAVFLSPEGLVGTFRKAHLWNVEKEIYEPGQEFPVYDTPLGRIAIAICYDAWFPETFRSASLGGADVLVMPSNWVPVPNQPEQDPIMANMMCQTGAHSNHLYVVAASRIGTERGQDFVGCSLVVGPDGWPIAGPAPRDEEAIVYADIDPVGTRDERWSNPFNQPVRDRRTDLYRA